MEYINPFLIGGSVIAGSKYVSTFASPALAPLIGGMPTGIIAALFLTSDKDRKKYYDGYVYSAFTLFLSVLFIHLMSVHTKFDIIPVSMFALILWAALSYMVVNIQVLSKK